MKAEVITTMKTFTPVEVRFTIESRQELMALWHRLNLAPTRVSKIYLSDYGMSGLEMAAGYTESLFRVIDQIVDSQK